jgi:DNA-binding transcriptional ArsR family regulator
VIGLLRQHAALLFVSLSKDGEGSVSALAEPFQMSMPAISGHLRVLEKARLIVRRRTGRLHLIRFRRAGLKQAQEWMAQCEAGLNFSFDALDELLKNEQAKQERADG